MRVRTATARCDSCRLLIEGDLLDGTKCPRCYLGTLMNVARIGQDEVPRPFTADEEARA
jgi:Zn finger protein HypA/HybF involved in hydrogenase expression